jgi:hypothetical protein
MHRHAQAGGKVRARRVDVGGSRDRAALRLQLLDEGGRAFRIIPGDVVGNVLQVRRGARREEKPARSLANTASASRLGPLSMPSCTRRRSSSISSVSTLRRRRQSRSASRTTSLTLP